MHMYIYVGQGQMLQIVYTWEVISLRVYRYFTSGISFLYWIKMQSAIFVHDFLNYTSARQQRWTINEIG